MKKFDPRDEQGAIDEQKLLDDLKRKDIRAFARFRNEYSNDLLIFAFTILEDAPKSIKKAHKLFLTLWELNRLKEIKHPIYNYLCEELRKICNADNLTGHTDPI